MTKADPVATPRESKLVANAEAIDRWQRKLFRAATELKKLTEQRKRLLAPRKGAALKYRRELADIPHMAGGGSEFSDDIPL